MAGAFILSMEEFEEQYSSCSYVNIKDNICPNPEDAYLLYLHYATNGVGFQLFGRIKNETNKFTAGFDESVYEAFEPGGYAFNPTKDMNKLILEDKIFWVGKDNEMIMEYLKRFGWTPALNDIWVLANVHARKDFIPISPLRFTYIFDKDFGVSVFGRELVGITLAGYIKKTLFGQETFVAPHNEGRPGVDKLSLVGYSEKMKNLSVGCNSTKKISLFRSYFKSVGLTIRS